MMTPEEKETLQMFLSMEDGFYLAVAYIDGMLTARDAHMDILKDEIECFKVQLESIRAAHDEAQSVLSVLNADPTVAIFQIATHFQTMGNKVGRILNEPTDSRGELS